MGFVVRSRFNENQEYEKSNLFHLNRENRNHNKNSLNKMKIKNQITEDKSKIEEEVLQYFGALFNGHHDRDGEDTGSPFTPEYAELPSFFGEPY